ncbi:MAG: hypothetical protein QM497_02435 [Sulfurimonas sp.]
MLKELDTLREIGAQKIYEDTHIALKYVQSVIHESFEDLEKIQFLGFVSILEREYKQDLSNLRAKGLEYFETEYIKESVNPEVFVVPKTKTRITGLYIFIALSIFIVAIYFSFDFSAQTKSVTVVDNSAIKNAQKNMVPVAKMIVMIDKNASDNNISIENIEKTETKIIEKQVVTKQIVEKKLSPLLVLPKSKLWIGYINKTDGIKKQTVVKHRLELDPNKEWLLSLGHGYVKMEVNGKEITYSSSKNLRFRYADGKLEKLSVSEFKKFNSGRLW